MKNEEETVACPEKLLRWKIDIFYECEEGQHHTLSHLSTVYHYPTIFSLQMN